MKLLSVNALITSILLSMVSLAPSIEGSSCCYRCPCCHDDDDIYTPNENEANVDIYSEPRLFPSGDANNPHFPRAISPDF